jgi:hypothetical protein
MRKAATKRQVLWERHAAGLHMPRVGAKRVGEFVETIDAEVSLNNPPAGLQMETVLSWLLFADTRLARTTFSRTRTRASSDAELTVVCHLVDPASCRKVTVFEPSARCPAQATLDDRARGGSGT